MGIPRHCSECEFYKNPYVNIKGQHVDNQPYKCLKSGEESRDIYKLFKDCPLKKGI